MNDRIEHIGRSLVQHGKGSDRVYLMKLGGEDPVAIIPQLEALASRHGYSKIFAKVPASGAAAFAQAGYGIEARVPGLYQGCKPGLFVSRFLDPRRGQEADTDAELYEQVLQAAQAKAGAGAAPSGGPGLQWRICTPDDSPAMAEVYRQVFESYPFPIQDPAYLRETMASHVVYFGVWRGDDLVALSSADRDEEAACVEMTDFATLPSQRGAGLAAWLLSLMEPAMQERGILTACTIARAASHGMNITFARLGYTYAGRLVNNTHIAGRLESMNVWYKRLAGRDAAR
jgi:putative beta-lysine N-acetyltransferase